MRGWISFFYMKNSFTSRNDCSIQGTKCESAHVCHLLCSRSIVWFTTQEEERRDADNKDAWQEGCIQTTDGSALTH